ncbi:hypothetical protein HDU92_006081, partial [Lobulomyces angularis]
SVVLVDPFKELQEKIINKKVKLEEKEKLEAQVKSKLVQEKKIEKLKEIKEIGKYLNLNSVQEKRSFEVDSIDKFDQSLSEELKKKKKKTSQNSSFGDFSNF